MPGIKLPPELAQLSGLSGLLANWRPCGLLDDQQQQTATSLCLVLLQQLHAYADKWEQPRTSMFEADGSLPNPSATTQALLQLLGHLTKRHSNAQQVCWQGRAGCMLCRAGLVSVCIAVPYCSLWFQVIFTCACSEYVVACLPTCGQL